MEKVSKWRNEQPIMIGALSYQISPDKLLERIVLGVSTFDSNRDVYQGPGQISYGPNPSPHLRLGIGLRF